MPLWWALFSEAVRYLGSLNVIKAKRKPVLRKWDTPVIRRNTETKKKQGKWDS